MPVRVRIGGARGGRGKNSFRVPRLTITVPTENELANEAARAELERNRANIAAGKDAEGRPGKALSANTLKRRKWKRDGVPGPRAPIPFVDTGRLRDGLRATRAVGSTAKVIPPSNRFVAVAEMANKLGRDVLGVHQDVIDAVLKRFLDAMVT